MILFQEDWNKPFYQKAIVDYDTPNKSFLEYVGLLEKMGVKNRFFPLALVHRELQGVDPYSRNLTREQIAMIVVECKTNPWYYFREVLRVPSQGSLEPVRLRANRGNIALWWLFFNHITSLLIQPRQTGKSLSTDSLMSWVLDLGAQNTRVNLLTKDDALRVANVGRLKSLLDELPDYLKIRTKKDTNNTETITVNALSNIYTTAVAQLSKKAALNICRGQSIPIHHVDEIAFCANIEDTLQAMLPSASAARDNAKAAGAPYGNIFTTTCGFLNSESGQYAKKIYDESLPWSEHLFDCENEEHLCVTIRKNNKTRLSGTPNENKRPQLQVLLEFNHRQLGYTDEWLMSKIEEAKSEGENAKADFLNIWGRGNEASPISPENLEIINKSGDIEPYTTVSRQGYLTRWYIDKNEVENKCPNRKLIMILDLSEAVGKDDIAMVIRDVVTGENVACGDFNETNLITFAKWIAEWLINWKNITLVPERKNMGAALIDLLIDILPKLGIDPLKRIFNWIVDEYNEVPAYKEIIDNRMGLKDPSIYIKYKAEIGYSTSGSGKASRDNVYGRAFNATIKHTGSTVRDKKLISQLNGLIFKNNRIDHKPGEHDDLVFCWALGYWFLTSARNKDLYGIPTHMVLSSITQMMISEEGGEEAVRKRNEQIKLKEKLRKLKEYIQHLTNPIQKEEYLKTFKYMAKDLEDQDDEILNIDEIENSIIETRNTTTKKEYYFNPLLGRYVS